MQSYKDQEMQTKEKKTYLKSRQRGVTIDHISHPRLYAALRMVDAESGTGSGIEPTPPSIQIPPDWRTVVASAEAALRLLPPDQVEDLIVGTKDEAREVTRPYEGLKRRWMWLARELADAYYREWPPRSTTAA